MNAVKFGEGSILNADMIINCALTCNANTNNIRVWYINNANTEFTFKSSEEAVKAFDELYKALKEQEK